MQHKIQTQAENRPSEEGMKPVLLSLPLPVAFRYLIFEEDSVLGFFTLCAVSVLCVAASAWAVLLDRGERSGVRKMYRGWVERIFNRKEA